MYSQAYNEVSLAFLSTDGSTGVVNMLKRA
jgi:hypothetical protein